MASREIEIKKDRTKAEEKSIRDFLKAKRKEAKAADIDKLKLTNDREVKEEMIKLHKTTVANYEAVDIG